MTNTVTLNQDIYEKLWELRDDDPAHVRKQSAQRLAEPLGKLERAKCLLILSFLDYRQGFYDETLNKAYEAQAIFKKQNDELWLCKLLGTLALCHAALGNNHLVFRYLDQQFRLAKKLSDYELVFAALLDLAIAHLHSNQDNAYEYFQLAESYVTNPRDQVFLYVNLGNYYLNQKDFKQAHSYIQKGRKIAEANSFLSLARYGYEVLANIATEREAFDIALAYSEQAIKLGKTYNLPEEFQYFSMAKTYLAKGETEKALELALSLCSFKEKQTAQTELVQIHRLLSRIYKVLGEFGLALQHNEKYIELKDIVYSEEQLRKARALEVIHRMDKLKAEAELLKEKNKELESYLKELEELHAEVKELSFRDALTGLHNRRYLLEQADAMFKLAKRYKRPLSLVMLDIDHFKSINDRFSHQTGDDVLKTIAEIMKNCFRDADLLARYGGEEFAILLPETSLDNAYLACEHLRKTVEAYPWSQIHADLSVTISLGLSLGLEQDPLTDVLKQADDQLYKAKRAGRNQVAY